MEQKASTFVLLMVHAQHISGSHPLQTGLFLNTGQTPAGRQMNGDNISTNRRGCCTDDKTHTNAHAHRHTWEYAVQCVSALNATLVVCMKNPFGLKRSRPKRMCCQCEDVLQQPGRLHIVSGSKCLFVVCVSLRVEDVNLPDLLGVFFTLLHYPAGKQLQPTSCCYSRDVNPILN